MQPVHRGGRLAIGGGWILGTLASLTICWTSCAVAPARPDVDSINLPVVPAASAGAVAKGPAVEVTRDGRVIFGGKERSVNELLAALAKDGSDGPVRPENPSGSRFWVSNATVARRACPRKRRDAVLRAAMRSESEALDPAWRSASAVDRVDRDVRASAGASVFVVQPAEVRDGVDGAAVAIRET